MDGSPLKGTWVPIAADVPARSLPLGDLRVKYLMFDAGACSIIDCTNTMVDSGHYLANDRAFRATMDIVGRQGPNAACTMLAIYPPDGNNLTVCRDLHNTSRPQSMRPHCERLLLCITCARASTALC